ncbi:hypothetical protein O3M35_012068 [Rhynocoris fuscipes]|uniref:DRBM domain-containing protein n=1 Tax=Rhynocoris fuscipes TaxID=488301 RepID=A0AAW1CSH2_9HEMI
MPRSKNRDLYEGTFKPDQAIFQKTPISILEELFPMQAIYSWAVARNVGCSDLYRCRVNVRNNTMGESISFSKKVAKHQAALDALLNLVKYRGDKNLEVFIRKYAFGGSEVLNYANGHQESYSCIENYSRGRSISRSRSTNRSRSRARSANRSRSRARSRSRSRPRSNYRSRSACRSEHQPYNFVDREWNEDISSISQRSRTPENNVLLNTDPVGFLDNECKLVNNPGPEYSQPFYNDLENNYVVYATLGPYTCEGYGVTAEEAKKDAATSVLNSIFFDDQVE